MTIELTILISVIGMCRTVYGVSRNFKQDRANSARQMAKIETSLQNMQATLLDIKTDSTSTKNDVKEINEKIARMDESIKQAHKRIDGLRAEVKRLD